jgi:hypothetical protein
LIGKNHVSYLVGSGTQEAPAEGMATSQARLTLGDQPFTPRVCWRLQLDVSLFEGCGPTVDHPASFFAFLLSKSDFVPAGSFGSLSWADNLVPAEGGDPSLPS